MENVSTKRMDKRSSAKEKNHYSPYSSKHVRQTEALLESVKKKEKIQSKEIDSKHKKSAPIAQR